MRGRRAAVGAGGRQRMDAMAARQLLVAWCMCCLVGRQRPLAQELHAVCSTQDHHCTACLNTTDSRQQWASPCVWMSDAVCDPKGSFGRLNCHRCVPLAWWEQRSQGYPGSFNTTQCERYPPSFVPQPPPHGPNFTTALCDNALGDRAGCWVGRWEHGDSTVPSSQLPDAPSLGNGYVGVLVGRAPYDGQPAQTPVADPAIDLWINSNANWGCSNNTAVKNITTGRGWNPGKLTAAVCQVFGLGGVSLSVPALGNNSTYEAEQRISSAQIYTRQNGSAGTLQTLTYIHPSANLLVTNVTWSSISSNPAPVQLEVALWMLVETRRAGTNRSGNAQLLSAWRDASSTGLDPSIRRVRTALAVALPADAQPIPRKPSKEGLGNTIAVGSAISLEPGKVVSVITAIADNLLEGNTHDSAAEARDLAQDQTDTGSAAGQIAKAAAEWWSEFWGRSAIALPQSPMIEAFWYGAQYATAAMAASAEMMQQTNGSLPPPGLYGPWVSADFPLWNGDFTLDYNQESQFYGVFNSNHAEHAASYFPPIEQWMPAARLSAQAHAAKGGLVCPLNALHYSCHLAPWGYQSGDQSEYMHWNGNFAALLFINHFEYTQDLEFARRVTYPLLEGLNAWWGCFLVKMPAPSGGYVYADNSTHDPDEEHEGETCANPQMALALIKRTLSAQLDIADAIGKTPEPLVADMLQHLPEFNTAVCETPDCVGQVIWTECAGHNVSTSDGFSLYPLWPSELVTLNSSHAEVALAQASLKHYTQHGHSQIKPVHLPSMMVRAGAHGNDTIAALRGFLGWAERNSFVPNAVGGGTENVGISVAINDMLVQSPTRNYIVLFPAWDLSQDASFRDLLVKGAVEVSASWNAKAARVENVSIVAREGHRGPVVIKGMGRGGTVACADGSEPRASVDDSGAMSFAAPSRVRCTIKPLGNAAVATA